MHYTAALLRESYANNEMAVCWLAHSESEVLVLNSPQLLGVAGVPTYWCSHLACVDQLLHFFFCGCWILDLSPLGRLAMDVVFRAPDMVSSLPHRPTALGSQQCTTTPAPWTSN
jgi:hypothetical protein